jgi:hypothetical protein
MVRMRLTRALDLVVPAAGAGTVIDGVDDDDDDDDNAG